jgi:F0F1-type ATP synthase assembly protein I
MSRSVEEVYYFTDAKKVIMMAVIIIVGHQYFELVKNCFPISFSQG